MASSNRRVETRLPVEGAQGTGTLLVGRKKYPVLVLDESMCGIGVVAVRVEGLDLGTDVKFESAVRHAEGRIGQLRHVTDHGEEVYRIGLEWTD